MGKSLALNNSGFSSVVALVAIGFIVAASLLLPTQFMPVFKNAQRINDHLSATVFRNVVFTMVSDPIIWQNMISNDPSLVCIKDSTDCYSLIGTPQPLRYLYDPANNLIFDANVATNGFTHAGDPCNTFDSSGNPLCPFRLEMTWQPLCSASPCVNPTLQINVSIRVKSSDSYSIRDNQYAIRVVK